MSRVGMRSWQVNAGHWQAGRTKMKHQGHSQGSKHTLQHAEPWKTLPMAGSLRFRDRDIISQGTKAHTRETIPHPPSEAFGPPFKKGQPARLQCKGKDTNASTTDITLIVQFPNCLQGSMGDMTSQPCQVSRG